MLGFAIVLAVGAVARAQIQCVDAARAGARVAARAEPDAQAVAVATLAAPVGAQVVLTHHGDAVSVVVRDVLRLPILGSPAIQVASRARADVEQAGWGDR